MSIGLLSHYRESRQVAVVLKQKPISNTANDVAAYMASPLTYFENHEPSSDGATTLALHIAKDITLRDAFEGASWYGRLAGPACLHYRWATERVVGVGLESSEKPIRLLSE